MSSKDTGGQAFPCFERGSAGAGPLDLTDPGMTLRDYFAAHAPEPPDRWHGGDREVDDIIEWRWYYADRMMKARSK